MIDLEAIRERDRKEHPTWMLAADHDRRALLAHVDALQTQIKTIDQIIEGFNVTVVFERDELKRENRRLTAENAKLRKDYETLERNVYTEEP